MMRVQEQYVVPALGVIILASSFMIGGFFALIILAVLGLATIGTYFTPPKVQVELRIGIAALGVLVLIVVFSSLGFWLALLAFGTMGGLQIRYRQTLTTPLATVEWAQALIAQRSATKAAAAVAGDVVGDGDGGAAPTAQPASTAPSGTSTGRIPVKIGGLGAAVLGLIVLLTAVMPWFSFPDFGDELAFSGVGLADELMEEADSPIPGAITGALLALIVLSVASLVLPRFVPIVVGVVGVAVMAFTFVYVFDYFDLSEAADYGISFSYGAGFWLATLAFLLMAVLNAIPWSKKTFRIG